MPFSTFASAAFREKARPDAIARAASMVGTFRIHIFASNTLVNGFDRVRVSTADAARARSAHRRSAGGIPREPETRESVGRAATGCPETSRTYRRTRTG